MAAIKEKVSDKQHDGVVKNTSRTIWSALTGNDENDNKYDSGGGGSSSSSTDNSTLNDTVNTINKEDVTTTSKYGADEGAISNLTSNIAARLRALNAETDAKRANTQQMIDQNAAIRNAQLLEADRVADDNWLRQTQKLQSSVDQVKNSIGNGYYGDAARKLGDMARKYDDGSDQDNRSQLRRTRNEVYQDYASAVNGNINDYNESMIQTYLSNIPDMLSDYIETVSSNSGGDNVQNTKTDQTENTVTNQTMTANTSSSSGGSSSTNTTDTTQNADITKNTTGNNVITTTVNSRRNRYFNDDGSLNYDKLGEALGIKFTNGVVNYDTMKPVKLQQQDHYMQSPNRVASLQRRYG